MANNTTTNANTTKFAPAKPVLTDGASSFQAGFESGAAIAQRNKAIKQENFETASQCLAQIRKFVGVNLILGLIGMLFHFKKREKLLNSFA